MFQSILFSHSTLVSCAFDALLRVEMFQNILQAMGNIRQLTNCCKVCTRLFETPLPLQSFQFRNMELFPCCSSHQHMASECVRKKKKHQLLSYSRRGSIKNAERGRHDMFFQQIILHRSWYSEVNLAPSQKSPLVSKGNRSKDLAEICCREHTTVIEHL